MKQDIMYLGWYMVYVIELVWWGKSIELITLATNTLTTLESI